MTPTQSCSPSAITILLCFSFTAFAQGAKPARPNLAGMLQQQTAGAVNPANGTCA